MTLRETIVYIRTERYRKTYYEKGVHKIVKAAYL